MAWGMLSVRRHVVYSNAIYQIKLLVSLHKKYMRRVLPFPLFTSIKIYCFPYLPSEDNPIPAVYRFGNRPLCRAHPFLHELIHFRLVLLDRQKGHI